MLCPRCNSEMYDNRATKKNPKAPDFKCSNNECRWKMTKQGWEPSDFPTAIWEPKDETKKPQKPQNAPRATTPSTEAPNGARAGMASNAARELHKEEPQFYADIASFMAMKAEKEPENILDTAVLVAQFWADVADRVK